jgi:hypothetical protein
VSEFGEDFRKQLEDAYHHLINNRIPRLNDARYGGVGGLDQWMRDEAYPTLERALECGEPGMIEDACAEIALAAMMMRDASRAMTKIFEDAYAGPEEGRDERLRDGLKAHALKMSGAQAISAERHRQIDEEKYDAASDDAAVYSELAHAAAVYLGTAINDDAEVLPPKGWPWEDITWKPASPIRMLVKAGALIAAEIDRRTRAGEKW